MDHQIIVDNRTFSVPADLPAGVYDLVVVLYDLESLEQFGETNFVASIEIEP